MKRALGVLFRALGFMAFVAACLLAFVLSFLLALKWGGGIGTGIWVFCWFCAVIWVEGDVTVVDDLTRRRR